MLENAAPRGKIGRELNPLDEWGSQRDDGRVSVDLEAVRADADARRSMCDRTYRGIERHHIA
jgi:hypothetical protein